MTWQMIGIVFGLTVIVRFIEGFRGQPEDGATEEPPEWDAFALEMQQRIDARRGIKHLRGELLRDGLPPLRITGTEQTPRNSTAATPQ
jgi:hypothetical protein